MNTALFNPSMKDNNLKSERGHENDALNQLPPQFQLKQEYQILSNNFKVLDKVNFQLGNELAQLQVRLGLFPNPQKFSKEQLDSVRFKPTNQKIDLSYIERLLNCYTAKIDKLEKMVEMANTEYRDMEQKADYLINDNSVLRQQLEEKCQLILRIYENGEIIDSMGNTYLKLEHEDMNERISLLTEENKELTAKFQEISGKFSETDQKLKDLQEKESATQKLYIAAAEKCKKLEIEAEQSKHQSKQSKDQLMQTIKKKEFYEGEKSDIDNKLSKSENEIKILKTQISNLKRNLGDSEAKKNAEIDSLKKQVEELREKDRENQQSISAFDKEVDSLTDENTKLTQERDQLREKQDQTTRMMDAYQSQIQTFEKKEENAAKLQKEQREKVQNALLEKDKAVLREQQVEKTLTTIQENNRQQINELKDQYDKIIESLKTSHRNTLKDREEEYSLISEELQTAIHEKDKAIKDLTLLQSENKRLSASIRDDIGINRDNRVQEKDIRIKELEERLQMMEQYHSDRGHAVNMEKSQIETSYRNQQQLISDLKTSNEKYSQKNLELTSENNQMKIRLQGSQKEKQIVLEEISQTKRLFETKLNDASEQFSYKMKDIQDQLIDALKRERTSREKAVELLQSLDTSEQQLKSKYEKKIRELEDSMNICKTENKALQQKCQRIFEEHPNQDR